MARAPSLTQSMSGVHTWVGLLLGWALFAIFLTGTLAVFDKEIDWWMAPELTNQDQGPVVAANVAQRWLQANHPTSSSWNIALPTERSPRLAVSVDGQRRGENTPLDVETGEPLAVRDTLGGAFFFHFHYTLHLPRLLGVWVVGFAAMAMLVALISGIIIHKKIFKDFFTFRPAKGQRSWLDGHNASAVLLLPFHLMITYTGLAIFCVLYMPAAVDALYDGDRQALFREADPAAAAQAGRGFGRDAPKSQAPAAPLLALGQFVEQGEAYYGRGMVAAVSVTNPGHADARVAVRPVLGNRIELTKGQGLTYDGVSGALLHEPAPARASLLTQRVLAGLHFAQFGGYPMRWLYFLCGLVSCAMIGSGLVLYAVKKRKQARDDRFLAVVERLNVSVIAGLTVACLALLWSNRLLPATLEARATAELAAFFGVWLATLLHAMWRPPLHAWREQLLAAAVLALALPLLDFFSSDTTDRVRLSIDTAAAVMGLVFGWTAWKVPALSAQGRSEPLLRVRPAGAAQ
ncbi:PepSY domain-containing protein [Stutzerimonas urumqiensis]|uniref:PepSY-associated TM helix domain-containing protein n=1 Tax=Stutzerimonas urumqiensis TaxID=638269 RepID=UPI003BA88789